MKVSVILPAYNAMAYLPETMANLLEQTYPNFEVVVVNDGSTDNILEWIATIDDPKIRLITQANKGLAGARNTGIRQSKGEFIAFLDADDLWEKTKLAKQVEVLEQNPEVGLVYTWTHYINEAGEYTGRTVKYTSEGDVWQELTQYNLIECGSVPMLRRSCLKRVGLFDEEFTHYNVVEDWNLWLRIAAEYPFKVVPEALTYYRQRTTSGSKNWELMAQAYRLLFEKAFADAPLELLHLRSRSYGNAHLVLAWKVLQSQARDYELADSYREQALRYSPLLVFSREYIRLSIAIALMSRLGASGYQKFLGLFWGLRRNIFSKLPLAQ
jgi:glycosyltransferase involved in cell wall biosynthesis